MSRVAVVALAVLTGLVLAAARPANEGSTPLVETADLLPGAVTVGPATPVERLASAVRVLPAPARRGESAEGREPMARERLQSP
ncbi:MAG TPA: hypothetical protein VF136_03070 [Methylomirabilota bacterium]